MENFWIVSYYGKFYIKLVLPAIKFMICLDIAVDF